MTTSPKSERVLVSWSGGKDSCLALHAVLQSGRYDVAGLLTTLSREDDAVGIHFLRRSLLERQAAALGLPLYGVYLPAGASNEVYETALTGALSAHHHSGIGGMVFGDLFLEDIRAYRETLLARLGLRGVYPLWGRDTTELIDEFLALGFRAVVTSVRADVLDASFVGQPLDRAWLARLPAGVDPCGENGEFHTFVYAGPLFTEEVRFTAGATGQRDGHYFCDLSPG